MTVTPQQLLAEAEAIAASSPRIRQFAVDATGYITDLAARVAALERTQQASPADGRLPLLLLGGS